MANPSCLSCKGRGLVFAREGTVQRQTQCTAEGCIGWTRDPTLEELVDRARTKVERARNAVVAAEAELGVLEAKLASQCPTCKGARTVTLGSGEKFPCPKCAASKTEACSACGGKGSVEIAGDSFSCPKCGAPS